MGRAALHIGRIHSHRGFECPRLEACHVQYSGSAKVGSVNDPSAEDLGAVLHDMPSREDLHIATAIDPLRDSALVAQPHICFGKAYDEISRGHGLRAEEDA